MKQPYPKLCHYLAFCGFLLLSTIIYSCKKGFTDQSIDAKAEVIEMTKEVDVAVLKNLYNQAVKPSGYQTRDLAGDANRYIYGTEVDWDNFELVARQASKIIQFDVKNDTAALSLRKSTAGDLSKYRNRTSVVFLEFNDGSRLNFFMKIIEDLSQAGSVSVIDKVGYGYMPAKFNGLVMYFGLDKKFINGYRFTGGKPVKKVTLSVKDAGSAAVTNTKKPNLIEVCEIFDVYYSWCNWVGTADNPHQSYNCTEPTYVYTETECTYIEVGGGGGDSGGVGGDTGGGPAGPTNPGCPQVGVSSVQSGKKVFKVRDECDPVEEEIVTTDIMLTSSTSDYVDDDLSINSPATGIAVGVHFTPLDYKYPVTIASGAQTGEIKWVYMSDALCYPVNETYIGPNLEYVTRNALISTLTKTWEPHGAHMIKCSWQATVSARYTYNPSGYTRTRTINANFFADVSY
ncbi:hypothetical protein ACFQ3S_06250 [Mucilaginibacter terrae]|uniref:hypothetical protein n=1 Tax=Mucilaginibacter terrae TaxID=1955052 RepID=UPI00362E97FC